MTDPTPAILAILDPASRLAATRAAYPDVVFDNNGCALGPNWQKIAEEMEWGI